LAYGGLILLRPFIPADIPLAQDATVDHTVLLFTLIVASLTAFITGIIPAFRVSSVNPGDVMRSARSASAIARSLKEGRSFTAGRSRNRVVAILVASEVALTLV